MNYKIKIKKQYSKVLRLLGGNPKKVETYIMCDEYDYKDALAKLREPELGKKIESAIEALGKTQKTLYYELITSPLKDDLKNHLCGFFWGEVNEDEIMDEIESRLSEYGFSFNDVVNYEVQSEPEIQMFGRFWSAPTSNAYIYLDVYPDNDEYDERLFLLQIDNAHNYEFDELEDRGS